MKNKSPHFNVGQIASSILLLRGQRVMSDTDLAKLYGIPTKALLQAVKRNRERFPPDFMYRLTKKEAIILRSQFVTSRWGGRRYQPYAFTEQGVAMLSSVLKSRQAILINIWIMRAFVQFKEFLLANKKFAQKLEKLEQKIGEHDKEIRVIFEAIRQLMRLPGKSRRMIGFHP